MKPFLLIGCLFVSLAALAQGTFTFTPSLMGAIQYDPDTGVVQSFTFPTPAVSLANYNAVQVAFTAPPGYAWLVTPYENAAHYYFDCSAAYSSPGTDYHQTADYSFSFVPGMASSVTGVFVSQRLSEQSFGFDAQFQFGGSVEFTALTITLHYVPGHDWQMAQRTLSPFSQADMAFVYTAYGPPDGLQHMFLVSTPEPSVATLALLGTALAILVRRRVRHSHNRPRLE